MNILVTGSSGRIGSKIAETVNKHGVCIGVDLVPGKFTTLLGNILNKKFMDEVMAKVDAVIHAAAYLTPHVGVVSDEEFHRVNVVGTEVLLELAIRRKIERFVFTSTTSVYGCTTRSKAEAVWVTEILTPKPEDIYDDTKLEGEKLCQQASQSGLNTIILRMSRCFPEPDNLQVFYRLYRGVGVIDTAEAHWLAVSSSLTGTHTFIISAESPFKHADTRTLLLDPWRIIDRIYPNAGSLFDQMQWIKPNSIDRVYVIDKAKKLLNYHPKDNFWEFLVSKAGNPGERKMK